VTLSSVSERVPRCADGAAHHSLLKPSAAVWRAGLCCTAAATAAAAVTTTAMMMMGSWEWLVACWQMCFDCGFDVDINQSRVFVNCTSQQQARCKRTSFILWRHRCHFQINSFCLLRAYYPGSDTAAAASATTTTTTTNTTITTIRKYRDAYRVLCHVAIFGLRDLRGKRMNNYKYKLFMFHKLIIIQDT